MINDTSSIRVVLADDQTAIREALATMLDLYDDISVVGAGADGRELVELVRAHHPDVVLTDLRMPNLDGADAAREILADNAELPILVLTTFDDDESVFRALDAGVRGYLTKDAGRQEIAAALRTAVAGQSVLDAGVQSRLVQAAATRGAPPATPAPTSDTEIFTVREREVLVLIADGLSNQEIAARLFVSESTVKTHINNLFAKADLQGRAQAVTYAFRNGIAHPSQ